jgi:hypothetical protein
MPWRGPDPSDLVPFPTLGYYVLEFAEDYLIVPDGPAAGEPLVFTPDQASFILRYYRVDERTGRRVVRRAAFSRSKGSGKSPMVAGLSLVEALGDVVGDGFDAAGEPVGRTWASLGFKPKVQVVGVSEDATANTWDPLLDMALYGRLSEAFDIEPMETFVNVPRGRIEFVTSAASSREGFRPVFAVMDQTESWTTSNGGVKLAATIRRNIAKVGGSTIETPNSFRPGTDSVSERTHRAAVLQGEGKVRSKRPGILWDHREAPADTDLTDKASLVKGLAFAFGCSAKLPGGCVLHGKGCKVGWVDLDRLVEDIWDPDTDPADARQYQLNQITSATDSWVQSFEWVACLSEDRMLRDRDVVTLGFDGSKGRKRGASDATALVAVRVSDGHAEVLASWEQPDHLKAWEVPEAEVDAAVRSAHKRFRVVGFYADPARWESWCAAWEAKYASKYEVKASAAHPVQWWINRGRAGLVVKAVAATHEAILTRALSHDGGSVMTRHVLAAFRDPTTSGLWIRKETPDSKRKIDAAWALVLAWQARLDAVAKGVTEHTRTSTPARMM